MRRCFFNGNWRTALRHVVLPDAGPRIGRCMRARVRAVGQTLGLRHVPDVALVQLIVGARLPLLGALPRVSRVARVDSGLHPRPLPHLRPMSVASLRRHYRAPPAQSAHAPTTRRMCVVCVTTAIRVGPRDPPFHGACTRGDRATTLRRRTSPLSTTLARRPAHDTCAGASSSSSSRSPTHHSHPLSAAPFARVWFLQPQLPVAQQRLPRISSLYMYVPAVAHLIDPQHNTTYTHTQAPRRGAARQRRRASVSPLRGYELPPDATMLPATSSTTTQQSLFLDPVGVQHVASPASPSRASETRDRGCKRQFSR
jgi:hypothetical protein